MLTPRHNAETPRDSDDDAACGPLGCAPSLTLASVAAVPYRRPLRRWVAITLGTYLVTSLTLAVVWDWDFGTGQSLGLYLCFFMCSTVGNMQQLAVMPWVDGGGLNQ